VGAGLGSWLAGWFGFGAVGRRVLLAAGMGAGVAAVFRSRSAERYSRPKCSIGGWFARLPVPEAVKPALGAGLAAIIGASLSSAAGRDEHALAVLGFGLGTLQQILIQPDNFTVGLLITLALGKLVTTPLTVQSGGSGGVFGPALVIGGCGGGALGLFLQPLGPQWIPPPTAFVLVGMAGFFVAAAKAPFSTLVIVCELTGDFGLIAPALGVCVGCILLSGRDSLFDSQPAHRTVAPVEGPSGCPSE
jgi:CIC family chloride channel protein